MNSYQYVIRCDTTNGYYKVGWASELPLGRFQHIELIIETESQAVINANHPIYQQACIRVFELNQNLILTEQHENTKLGWKNVLLNLDDPSINIMPDEFGCFNSQAAQTRYRLSRNSSDVWAVICLGQVVQIETRYPFQKMPELEYQIWKHHKLDKLKQVTGVINQGKLAVCNSGLWFIEHEISVNQRK